MSRSLDVDGRRMVRNVRIDCELADWAAEQARARNVGIGPIVEEALQLLRDTEPNQGGAP